MLVKVMNEYGIDEAICGLSLSYGTTFQKATDISKKLAHKDGGHNKFLESIMVWLDVTAPRYFWQQLDTYRVGITKQSESTMHTIMKKPLTQANFEKEIRFETLIHLNNLIYAGMFDQLKVELPEGFLQRRIICTNYKVLRNIISQRLKHKLVEWQVFCNSLYVQLTHNEYLEDVFGIKK